MPRCRSQVIDLLLAASAHQPEFKMQLLLFRINISTVQGHILCMEQLNRIVLVCKKWVPMWYFGLKIKCDLKWVVCARNRMLRLETGRMYGKWVVQVAYFKKQLRIDLLWLRVVLTHLRLNFNPKQAISTQTTHV